MTILGLSAGATTSLSVDVRLSILYISILLLPTIISVLIYTIPYYIHLVILLSIYYITQIILVVQAYKKCHRIDVQEKNLHRVTSELYKKQNLLHHFVEEAPIAIFSYDTKLRLLDCNSSLLILLNQKRKEIVGLDLHGLSDYKVVQSIKNALHDGSQKYIGPYKSIKGFSLWVEIVCFPFVDENDNVVGGIGIIEDKTKEHDAQAQLDYYAKHDTLTTLPNRRGFLQYMEALIEEENHKRYTSLLFFIDLNRFKYINDTLGHAMGDALLVEVSKRLSVALNITAHISRIGGDEFIVVVPFVCIESSIIIDKANDYAEVIRKVIAEPYIISDMHLYIQLSIGIVIINANENDIEQMVRHADVAMYKAKEDKERHSAFYTQDLDDAREKNFTIQQDLVSAAKANELRVFFQPIVSIKENTLYAAEALIRWYHPKYGLISPNEFIPIAIETGMISDVTWWIVNEVCQQISQWKKEGQWKLNYVSININAKQLLMNDFYLDYMVLLEKHNLSKNDIMLEITESSLIENFVSTQEMISKLRKEGICCAIDDFGTGYSSLSYLKRLAFDTLKIDREFVRDLEKNNDIVLLKAILNIAKEFGYTIVVEGIETESQRDILLSLDETILYQGYLFGKAVPSDVFIAQFLS